MIISIIVIITLMIYRDMNFLLLLIPTIDSAASVTTLQVHLHLPDSANAPAGICIYLSTVLTYRIRC